MSMPLIIKDPQQAQQVPIDPTTNDPYYRYKMHQLSTQQIGSGKMMRTAFLNCDVVAKDLKIPPNYLPMFFGYVFGAKAAYDKKKPPRERASISGHYLQEQMQETMAKFLTTFILCTKCALPEWSYVPLKKRIGLRCRACGKKSYVDSLDLPDKFKRYVANKPPPKTQHMDKSAAKSQKEAKARRKEDAKVASLAAKLDVDVDDDDVEWNTAVSSEAMAQRAAEMVPETLSHLVHAEAPVEDDAKNGDAPAAPAAATDAADEAELIEKVSSLAAADAAECINVVTGIKDAKLRIAVLCGALSPTPIKFGPALKKHTEVFAKAVGGDKDTAVLLLRHFQAQVEPTVDREAAALKSRSSAYLKVLYDEDIVEEDAFLEWRQSKPGKLGEFAKNFLNWLEEADEESEE